MDDIAIIGGGAAGLIAAISACESSRCLSGRFPNITIYEKDEKIARSILRSGNGRCNYSNSNIDTDVYHNSQFVKSVLSNLSDLLESIDLERTCNPVKEFFEQHGLISREESEGRLYPATNKASTIVDIFRHYLECYDVEVQAGVKVEAIDPATESHPHFTIKLGDKRLARARKAIVCSGSFPEAFGLDNLVYSKPEKMLGPVKTDTTHTKPLDNIRVRCIAKLSREGQEVSRERGEIIFRKYGLSGIAIFNLSRLARMGDMILLDLVPTIEQVDMPQFLSARVRRLELQTNRKCSYKDLFAGMLLPLVAEQLLKQAEMNPDDLVDISCIDKLAHAVKSFEFPFEGIGDPAQCQVSRGGFDVCNVNELTLEAINIPGLFITGEALDVDAPCGGYNLHWAFSSGMLAGINASRS